MNLPLAKQSIIPSRNALVMTALGLLAALILQALPASAEDERSIQITGEAERRVAPDMAMLRMEIVEEHEQAAVARAEVDRISAKALGIIRAAGVAAADTDTTGMSISPRYRWNKSDQRQEITGYRVGRSIEIRLLDLDKLGDLLTQLSDAGVNQMSAPEPGLTDRETIYQQVLAAAAENARVRASAMASALGEELGPVISMSAHGAPSPRPLRREMAMMSADAATESAPQSYQAGHITFRVNVSANFALR